jgi:hypothetical protein
MNESKLTWIADRDTGVGDQTGEEGKSLYLGRPEEFDQPLVCISRAPDRDGFIVGGGTALIGRTRSGTKTRNNWLNSACWPP